MAYDSTLEAFMGIPRFSLPIPSPNQEWVAVFSGEPDEWQLRILEIKEGMGSGEAIADASKSQPLWDPGGHRLFYLTRTDGSTSIRAVDTRGTTERVTLQEGRCNLETVSPDGRFLYFTTEGTLCRYDFDVKTNEEILSAVRFVPGADYHLSSTSVFCSPDGARIAFTVDADGSAEGYHPTGQICVANADGTERRSLTIDTEPLPASTSGFVVRDWHPDSHKLLVATHPFSGYCGIYDIGEGCVEWFGTELDASDVPFPGLEVPLVFRPDGTAFVAWRLQGSQKVLAVYGFDGDVRTFELGGEVSRSDTPDPQFLDSENLLFVRENEIEPGDLVTLDTTSGETDTLLKVGYGDVDAGQIVDPARVRYQTAEESTAPGLLYKSGERSSPAIVEVYSGYLQDPGWPREFRRDVQYLVANGYTVFQAVNPARMCSGASHANNAAAGEWVKHRDWIDEDRVAVYGFSVGGYDALMQAFRYPETWAACVSGDGFPDLFDADERHGGIAEIRGTLGDPAENESDWRAQNPMDELERLEDGLRCPLLLWGTGSNTEAPFQQLREKVLDCGWTEGSDFHYVYLPAQDHVAQSASDRTQRWRPIVTFLDDTLQNA